MTGSSSAITGVRRIRKISWKFEDENLIKYRRFCKNGPAVSAMGSGRMGMSEFYGGRDNTASVATIHRALELRIVNSEKTTELENKL